MGIVELGGVIITQATQRVESAAQNMANLTTAGYKSRRRFQGLVDGAMGGIPDVPRQVQHGGSVVDFTPGKLQHTGNPLDLALSGPGFFTVRGEDGDLLFTRSGQFSRDPAGRLVLPSGALLQSTSGDVQLDSGDISVLADGTIQQKGEPVSQLAIAAFDDTRGLIPVRDGLFSAPRGLAREAVAPRILQGMLEASNVTSANEMISMMTGLRSAEAGQRLVQVYDDLMGRAITTFGQM